MPSIPPNQKKNALVATGAAAAAGIVALAAILLGGANSPDQFTYGGSVPLPFNQHADYSGWDVQVHSRDVSTWDDLESMQAEHGGMCEGPPSVHETHTYDGAVFACKDHLMTAISAGGYGVVYLTPDKLADWTNQPVTIQWDMSTEISSARDWPDIWVTPWDQNLALPFDTGSVDLQNTPAIGLHISFNDSQYAPVLTTYSGCTVRTDPGCVSTNWNRADSSPVLQAGIAAGTNQAASRQTFRVTVTNTHVKFERLSSSTGSAVTYFDVDVAPLGFTQGVVQWGHHSYNPEKDCSPPGVVGCQPGTQHWDNFQINPSVPFTIIHSTSRFVEDGGTIGFTAPAPANSFLRFSAIGKVTVNGQPVSPQIPTTHNEHFNSYFLPIPEGTQNFKIGLSTDAWYQGPFRAKDFTIWNKDFQQPQATPTASPVLTVIATSTPISAPTNTPEPTFTPTFTPSPTNTPVVVAGTATKTLTPTKTATATKTPTPLPFKTCTVDWAKTPVTNLGPMQIATCQAYGR